MPITTTATHQISTHIPQALSKTYTVSTTLSTSSSSSPTALPCPFFFFNDRAPPEISPLPLPAPLPISDPQPARAQPHPFAAADDTAAPRRHVTVGGDGQADAAAELDPVQPLVEIDQHRQRVGGPRLAPRRPRDDLGGLACDPARRRGAVETDRRADLAQLTRHDAAAKDLLGARQVGDARGDLTPGERLHDRERALAGRERAEDDALQRVIVLGQDEVAEPLAHFPLDRLRLLSNVAPIRAAPGQLGLELRLVGAEAELHAAVGHERVHAGEERIDVRFAEPGRIAAAEVDRRREPAARQQPRDHLLLEHALELSRHARRGEEAGLADVDREAAGGADRIVDHLGGGPHNLLAPVFWLQLPAAPACK